MTPFKSTAEFYSRFRVPYPDSLVARLKADADLGYDAQVLDLATGPGRLALALALPLQSPQPGSARGNPSQEKSPQPGSARGNPSQEKSPQPGSARGNPSQEKSPQPGSARGNPSQEKSPQPGSAREPPRRQIVAVDVETEMLEEGKRVARRKGVANVEWVHSRAADLTVAPGSLDLVTIGEAFHRLDQDVVRRRTRQWLKAGGCVAIVGCFGVLDGSNAWQESLRRAVSDWVKARPAVPSGPPRGKVHDARRLVEAGFANVINREFVASHTWTRESILGHLHSTSRYSLAALGDERDDFDRVVLAALDAVESAAGERPRSIAPRRKETDRFPQEVSCGYTIGWNGGG